MTINYRWQISFVISVILYLRAKLWYSHTNTWTHRNAQWASAFAHVHCAHSHAVALLSEWSRRDLNYRTHFSHERVIIFYWRNMQIFVLFYPLFYAIRESDSNAWQCECGDLNSKTQINDVDRFVVELFCRKMQLITMIYEIFAQFCGSIEWI